MFFTNKCFQSSLFFRPVNTLIRVPFYHLLLEFILVIWIIRLLMSKSYQPKEPRLELTKEEEENLIKEWEPEPLVPKREVPDYVSNPKIVSGKSGININVNGKDCLNLATFNFLGLVGNKQVEDGAIKSLRKYGVGTCGPRGFYGTIDVHLDLEKKLAEYMQTEEAILYSYGFSTIASVIPAYSKRTDVIFCDSGVSFATQKGIVASRSKVYWFKHNDIEDLEKCMLDQQERDKKNPKKSKVTRRFLVVEGLYANYGDIAPLQKLIELKYKYKVRLFVEETMSFGVLGKYGRGITEHFGIPISDVDLIAVSLETSLASIGGFCCGTSFVIDHQRLSGQGYCFSASLPPLLATAADVALDIMKDKPDMFERLQNNARLMRSELKGCPLSKHRLIFLQILKIFEEPSAESNTESLKGLEIKGDQDSPIIHLRLSEKYQHLSRNEQEDLLQLVADKVMEEDIAVTLARYLNDQELYLPDASIRVTVNCDLTQEQIKSSAAVLRKAEEVVLK